MRNNEVQDIYNKYISKNIENISSPDTPAHLWSNIKGRIKENDHGFQWKNSVENILMMFSMPQLKIAYAVAAVFIVSLLSVNQYQGQLMHKEVNGYLIEYVLYVSSDKSLVEDVL